MEPSIIGISQHIENIKILINQIAKTEENVLVLGEKGVGKDLVVQNLYHRSKRVGKPFVKIVDCLNELRVVFFSWIKLVRFLLLFKPNFFSCCKVGIASHH
jgi:hypothetical protein